MALQHSWLATGLDLGQGRLWQNCHPWREWVGSPWSEQHLIVGDLDSPIGQIYDGFCHPFTVLMVDVSLFANPVFLVALLRFAALDDASLGAAQVDLCFVNQPGNPFVLALASSMYRDSTLPSSHRFDSLPEALNLLFAVGGVEVDVNLLQITAQGACVFMPR